MVKLSGKNCQILPPMLRKY